MSVTTAVFSITVHHYEWADRDDNIPNVILAECKQIMVEPAGNDPFGQIIGGHIKFLCHLRPGHDRISKRTKGRFNNEKFDAGYDHNNERQVLGAWYCVLAYREGGSKEHSASCHLPDPPLQREWGYITGLILEIAQESPRTYRRIGLFSHAWGRGRPDYVSDDYPEFIDVDDPKSLPREEIIIV